MIDRSLVYSSYPQDRINTQVIYRFALEQVGCTSSCLLTNCKQKITSLSLFVGTTIHIACVTVIIPNRLSTFKQH